MGTILLTLLGLGLGQEGVVDRIEGDWAVIEWSGSQMGDVPNTFFVAPLHECQRIKLVAVALDGGIWRGDGRYFVLDLPSGQSVRIPGPKGVLQDERYAIVFQRVHPMARRADVSLQALR